MTRRSEQAGRLAGLYQSGIYRQRAVKKNSVKEYETELPWDGAGFSRKSDADEIIRMLAGIVADFKSIGLHPAGFTGLSYNSRLRRALARCRRSESGFILEISPAYLQMTSRQAKTDILAHEVIHTFPDAFSHGPGFQKYAKILNSSGKGYQVTSTFRYDTYGLEQNGEPEPRYILECLSCHHHYPRQRMCDSVRNVQKYRCSRCGGKLRRIQ